MDLPFDLQQLLESTVPGDVEETKKKFHEYFNNTKESWLLNGLVDFYLSTGSTRCVDILVCVREPHDAYFFNKIAEILRGQSASRLNILNLLGYVVVRQPTWLYKIAQHSLFKELLKILKTETDLVNLISALLTLVILLPMIPPYVGASLQDIFEVFSRLAAWNTNNPNKLHSDQLIHLQISLHFLFNRLYGMYPCNFLSFLRQQYSSRDSLAVFSHTIKPMLDTVKMHPLLVTTSKETETTTGRWKTMGHHDVVVECAKLAVDARDDALPLSVATFRTRSESEIRRLMESSGYQDLKAVQSQTIELKDLWSPSVDKATTPPLPPTDYSAPASIPLTPVNQNYVVSSAFPHQIGTSPPEAAVEATPETTPVKDPRLYAPARPPPASSVVRALNHLSTPRWNSSTTTPNSSQPSSPMKKENSPFRFPEQPFGESKLVQRKIQAIKFDRQHVLAERAGAVNGSKVSHEESAERLQDEQEDQEVLEISQQGEMRMSSSYAGPNVRQCDSVLQDYHTPHEEDLEFCEQESGSRCPSGGLHMANSRSLQNFKRSVHSRLRYHSQSNNNPHSPPASDLGGSEPKRGSESIATGVRRAISCPEMKKTRPSFTGNENPDEPLDERPELDTATVSTATQTSELEMPAPYPYEHMFLALFPPGPTLTNETESKPPPARRSPTTVLDQYLDLAAARRHTEEPILKRSVSVLESELKTVRDQLDLLHLQLKFERHRRDSHAERNRRLLGVSRGNRMVEEHNNALQDQLMLLEKDIDSLHEEMQKNKDEFMVKLKKAQEDVDFLQDKSTNLELKNRELKSENQSLNIQLKENKELQYAKAKKLQQAEAMVFMIGKELKEALAQANAGEALKNQVSYLQKELVLIGEHELRSRSQLAKLSMRSDHQKQFFKDCYQEQVQTLNAALDGKATSCEALKARITELEASLARKDKQIAEQKRDLKAVKEECREELEAVEVKHKAQTAANRKLEAHIMELISNGELGRRPRRNVSTAQDALSLAERGGMNSPLSLSLSSSEGLSLSSTLTSDAGPSRDLQAVVDISEVNRVVETNELDDLSSPGTSQDCI